MAKKLLTVCLFFLFFASVKAALIDDLVSYYPFDSNSSDVHGDNDLSAIGSVQRVSTNSIINNASFCDGGTWDSANNVFDSLGDTVSYSWWQNLTSLEINNATFSNEGIHLSWDSDGENNMDFSMNGGTTIIDSDISANKTWIFMTMIHTDSDRILIYKNSDLILNSSSTITDLVSPDRDFAICGQWDEKESVAGYIDEFGVWNKSLNQTEINDLYNEGNGFAYPFEETPDATMTLHTSLINNTGNFSETELNFTYNATFTNHNTDLGNISFYINDIFNITLMNINLSLNNFFNISIGQFEGFYNISFNATSGSNVTDDSGYFYYKIDTINPTISTDFTNNSEFIQNEELEFNFTFEDTNLFAYNISIFDANNVLWSNENYFAENLTVTKTENVTTRTLTDTGTFHIEATVWDSHTTKKLKHKAKIIDNNLLEYNNILFFCYNSTNISFIKEKDRIKPVASFDIARKNFQCVVQGNFKVVPNSKYSNHYVDLKNKIWFDENEEHSSRVDKGNIILTYNFDKKTRKIISESIGDLNVHSEVYFYEVVAEDILYLSDINKTATTIKETGEIIQGGIIMIALVFLAFLFVVLALWTKMYPILGATGLIIAIMGTQLMDIFYNYSGSEWYKAIGIGFVVAGLGMIPVSIFLQFFLENSFNKSIDRNRKIMKKQKKKDFYNIYN